MNSNSLRFNGIRKPYLLVLSRKRTYWSPIKREFIPVPGMPGAHLGNTQTNVRVEEVTVEISAESATELRSISEDLSAWLLTEKPASLIFDDEPDRTYYAVVDGSFDPNEIVTVGYGTLRFACPDPFKHGPEKSISSKDGTLLINNEGTVPTQPIVEIEVKEPTTFLAIGDGDRINMVGDYQEAGEVPYIPLERKLWDQMNDLTGWSDAQTAEDATVSGQMKSNGYQFYCDNYGTGSHWHGPAVKKSIAESLQDFRIEAHVDLREIRPRDIGRIVITALDEQSNMVAHMQIRRPFRYEKKNYGYFQAGNGMTKKTLALMSASKNWMWSNFSGILRIERVGNRWHMYMSTVDPKTGVYTYGMGRTFIDNEGRFTNKIRQIQVHLATYADWDKCWQRINDIKIFKVNEEPDGIEYIAVEGDKVIFDHVGNAIYRNGELIKDKKTFAAKYFDLKPGQSALIGEPASAIENMKARWSPKWH